jgi:hypothetical protein
MFSEPREKYPRFFISHKIEIRESPIHGVGVFAAERLESREIIEACPVIVFHRDTMKILGDSVGGPARGITLGRHTRHVLMEYPFKWTPGMQALAMGWGGLYNHSTDHSNAFWQSNIENQSLDFYTRKAVESGEELCIRYVPVQNCGDLWFLNEDERAGTGRASIEGTGQLRSSPFRDDFLHFLVKSDD